MNKCIDVKYNYYFFSKVPCMETSTKNIQCITGTHHLMLTVYNNYH